MTHHLRVLVLVVLSLNLHVLVWHIVLPLLPWLHLVGVKQVRDRAHVQVLDWQVRWLQLDILQVSKVGVVAHWVQGHVAHQQVVRSLLLLEEVLLLQQLVLVELAEVWHVLILVA